MPAQADAAESPPGGSNAYSVQVCAALSGDLLCCVPAAPEDTVADLKRAVIERIGGDAGVRLYHDGSFLKDREVLGAVLHSGGDAAGVRGAGVVTLTAVRLPPPRVVSASQDGSAKLWQLATGECLQSFLGHCGGVNTASLSPDGLELLTASDDKTAKLWSIQTGDCLRTFAGHELEVLCAAFSPRGGSIATASRDGTARLWDLECGQCYKTYHASLGWVRFAAYNPDGASIITCGGDEAKIWATQPDEASEVKQTLAGHAMPVLSAAFSSDGCMVVTASDDRSARLWWVASGECLAEFWHRGQVSAATFGLQNRAVITASGSSAMLWSAVGWECVQYILHEGREAFRSAAFSPDGSKVLATSDDGYARLYAAETAECVLALRGATGGKGKRRMRCAAMSPDGLIIAAADGATQRLFAASTGERLQDLAGHTRNTLFVTFSPDGRSLASASSDGTARLWDVAAVEALAPWIGCTRVLVPASGRVLTLAFSPNSLEVATATSRGCVDIWLVATGEKLLSLEPLPDPVCSVAYDPRGRSFVTASGDGHVQLWSREDASRLRTLRGHERRVRCASFGLDGHGLVTASDDRTARLWCLESGSCVRVLRGHHKEVLCAAFSPVAKAVVTASADGTVRLWSAVGWEVVHELRHAGNVLAAGFSPNSRAVVTACEDSKLKVWSAESGRCMRTFTGHAGPVRFASFSPQ